MEYSPQIQVWLRPDARLKYQSDEYYAAHYLAGSNLFTGNSNVDEGNVRSLAHAFSKAYRMGADHAANHDFRVFAV